MGAQGWGGETELLPPAAAGRNGISIIIFSFKASLTENYKLICSLNTQVRDQGRRPRSSYGFFRR